MKYFSINELTRSDIAKKLGVDNYPGQRELINLNNLVKFVLDPLRELYGKPIYVTSGYRSKAVNDAAGGSNTSQHMKGQAADIKGITRDDNIKIYNLIRDNLDYDQLINEYDYSWIHVSYNSEKRNRKQQLKIG